MRRFVATAAMSLTLLGLAGCKGPCRELSEKLCDCFTNSLDRELCIRRTSNDEAFIEPTAEDEAACEARLEDDRCTCEALDSPDTDIANDAKVACGLAR